MMRFPPHYHEGYPTQEDIDRAEEEAERREDIRRDEKESDDENNTSRAEQS